MKVTAKTQIEGEWKEATVHFKQLPAEPTYDNVVSVFGKDVAEACCIANLEVRLKAYVRGMITEGLDQKAIQAQTGKYDPSATRARLPVDPEVRAERLAIKKCAELAAYGISQEFADLPSEKKATFLARCREEVDKKIAQAQARKGK